VQNDQASRTAVIIAASLVLLHHDPKFSSLVSKTSADFCTRMLEEHSARTRLFSKIVQQGWFRSIAKLIERGTIPGILLHYVLRKKCIRQLVRSALINGATQVVMIGAGFDPLGFELHKDFPNAGLWEIDHPATQRHKVRAFTEIDAMRLHFVSMDLSAATFDSDLLIKNDFDPTQRTVWIAEGLLMYLTQDAVSSLMKTLKNLSAPSSSRFVFTFMEKQSDGRIRFDSQSKLIDWWLLGRGEPFRWGATRSEVIELVRPWHVVGFFDHNELPELASGLADTTIARGEVICVAEN
jgi:methyltransferase (TIGR00027 family)